jgi:2-keto-3-deoxy-L-fuconate dehydrogenase
VGAADLTGLTHAVVNAGIGAGAPIAETSFEEWRRVMSVNLDGAFLTLKAAMRAMQDRRAARSCSPPRPPG